MIFFGWDLRQEGGSKRGTQRGAHGPLWGLLALPLHCSLLLAEDWHPAGGVGAGGTGVGVLWEGWALSLEEFRERKGEE